MATVEFRTPPRLGPSYARALLPRRRTGGPLPGDRLVLPHAAADPRRLARYAEVCGFPAGPGGPMPATYPHVMAFPLAMALMARRDFPHALPGLRHIALRLEQRRPIGADERLDLAVYASGTRPHHRGTAFDVHAEAADASGTAVWRSVSTYLAPGAPPPGTAPAPAPGGGADETPDGGWVTDEVWDVPAATGRRYAAVSGDRNPIHLHALAARPFGFRRAIAHGMWTAARCLAALAPRQPDALTLDVRFRAPVMLPGRVRFLAAAGAFQLRPANTPAGGTARPHLSGTVGAPAD